MEAKIEIKIAYIGGGSQGWAHKILADLALSPHLTGEIALYDINRLAAEQNAAYGAAVFAHPQAKTAFHVTVADSSRAALSGADVVFLSIQPGRVQLFANDLDIPAKYGILQTVGDTTGPGGISRALRSIPIYVHYAAQIAEICPEAWVINYTNPMTLCTQTLYTAFPEIKAIGCCHEVFGTQKRLAALVADRLGGERPPRQEIKLEINGVNHFTFATAASYLGEDIYPLLKDHIADEKLWEDQTKWSVERQKRQDYMPSKGLIAFNFLRLFGVLGAAGDRHLVEFVPWYLNSESELHRYGVRITPSSSRLKPRKPKLTAPFLIENGRYINDLVASDEESVAILHALFGFQDLETNVNLPNRGQSPDLPQGHVVETNASIRKNQITPLSAKPLPRPVHTFVQRIIDVQQMTLQAGLNLDKELAFEAILADPLCTIPIDTAWQMFSEMLCANREMLPGWKFD